jgi:phenylacetate-coenzyme A ligase PaaK-like adenylate-forming protein
LAVLVYVLLNRTTFGYELKACGYNRSASRYAGINEKRSIMLSMTIAGALAGAAGGLMYLAPPQGLHIHVEEILSAQGFNGIPVALLGLSHPIGIIFSGLFVAYITVGGSYLQVLKYMGEIIDVIVGIPSQILRLSRTGGAPGKPTLKSVLLSADTVPFAVTRAVSEAWDVPVYGHYGMTETGLGGGVECAARDGYHLREADLLFEIVDPVSGRPLPDGEIGEIVVTTLTRRGMPLIRYRTGDRSRIVTVPCPCGTVLRRLDRVSGRIGGLAALPGGRTVSIEELDELVYADPAVLAYSAEMTLKNGADCLVLTVDAAEGFNSQQLCEQIDALTGGLVTSGHLLLELRLGTVDFHTTGTLKRRLADHRHL